MTKEEVKCIKKGQFIEFSYMPGGEIYTREVKSVDIEDGHHVYIEGIIKDSLFMVVHREVIRVVDSDGEKAVLV